MSSITSVSAYFIGDIKQKQYTYKVLRAMQPEENALAVVETASGFKLVKIVEVHDEPQLTGPYEYKFIAAIVDLRLYNALQQVTKTANNPTW